MEKKFADESRVKEAAGCYSIMVVLFLMVEKVEDNRKSVYGRG
jgi:hypothetical protein